MARFKRKARARRIRGGFKRFARRSGSGSGNVMGTILGGVAYGAGRQYAANLVKPITDKVPMGNYADNIVMGAISYFLAKGKIPFLNKIPMARDIGKAGLVIESAMIGQEIISGTGLGSTKTAEQNGYEYY